MAQELQNESLGVAEEAKEERSFLSKSLPALHQPTTPSPEATESAKETFGAAKPAWSSQERPGTLPRQNRGTSTDSLASEPQGAVGVLAKILHSKVMPSCRCCASSDVMPMACCRTTMFQLRRSTFKSTKNFLPSYGIIFGEGSLNFCLKVMPLIALSPSFPISAIALSVVDRGSPKNGPRRTTPEFSTSMLELEGEGDLVRAVKKYEAPAKEEEEEDYSLSARPSASDVEPLWPSDSEGEMEEEEVEAAQEHSKVERAPSPRNGRRASLSNSG